MKYLIYLLTQKRFRKPLLSRRIIGNSMCPALKPGTVIVATGWFARVKEGDVIVFEHRGREKIKRITNIDKEMVFVSGDNRQESTDSRHFGEIHKDLVIAKTIWPRV